MSADNGWVLRKRLKDNKYVLQHYLASDEEYPDIDSETSYAFDTLEEAIKVFTKKEMDGYPSEYGLRVLIDFLEPE